MSSVVLGELNDLGEAERGDKLDSGSDSWLLLFSKGESFTMEIGIFGLLSVGFSKLSQGLELEDTSL